MNAGALPSPTGSVSFIPAAFIIKFQTGFYPITFRFVRPTLSWEFTTSHSRTFSLSLSNFTVNRFTTFSIDILSFYRTLMFSEKLVPL